MSLDTRTFAEWEVDYVKLDGCFAEIPNIDSRYEEYGKLLNATGRPMVYSCSWPAYLEEQGIRVSLFLIHRCNFLQSTNFLWLKGVRFCNFLLTFAAWLWTLEEGLQFMAQLERYCRFLRIRNADYGLLLQESGAHPAAWWSWPLEWSGYGKSRIAFRITSEEGGSSCSIWIELLFSFSWSWAIMVCRTTKVRYRWLFGLYWRRLC